MIKSDFPKNNEIPVVGRFRSCLDLIKKYNLRGKVLLDVGSSTGLLESKLYDKNLKRIIGVEPNKKAVDFAKKNVKDVEFYVGTADNLLVKNNSCDIVTMFDVIEHVPENGEIDAFKEVRRVLKKGGVFLLSTPNNNLFTNLLDPAWYFGHRHYKPEQIKKMLVDSKFKILSVNVRGELWFSIYLIWLYFVKRFNKSRFPRFAFLENLDDQGFTKNKGIHTIFIEACKV